MATLLTACGGGGGGDSGMSPSDGTSLGSQPSVPTSPNPPGQDVDPPPIYAYDTTARFEEPRSLSIGHDDALYVFDKSLRIRKVSPSGEVITLPGELPAETTLVRVDSLGDFYVVSGPEIYRQYKDGRRQHLATLPVDAATNLLPRFPLGAVDSNDNLYLRGPSSQRSTVYKIDNVGNLSVFYSGAPLNYFTTGLAIDRDDKVIVHVREENLAVGHLVSITEHGVAFYHAAPGNQVYGMAFDASNALYLKTSQIRYWDDTELCITRGLCASGPYIYYYSRVEPDGTTSNSFSYMYTEPWSDRNYFGGAGLVADRFGNQYALNGHAVFRRTPEFQDSLFAGNPNEAGFSD